MKFCCYGLWSWDIGKVIKEYLTSDGYTTVEIQYYPNQMYSPELWDGNYVKIFKNFKEAKKFYLQETSLQRRRISVIKDWEKYLEENK